MNILVISCRAHPDAHALPKLMSMRSPSEPSLLFPNSSATSESTSTLSSAEDAVFSLASKSDIIEAENESASDSATTEYHSFSDSDMEDDETTMTEDERKLEREVRAVERQLVLEAAGIIVKKDSTGRPPRIQRRRTIAGVQPKHRPAPAPPPPPTSTQQADLGELDRHTGAQEHLDDAYERYEAFKQQSSRLSMSSIDQPLSLPPASPGPGSGSFSLTPAQSHESLSDKERSKENVSSTVISSSSYGSRISHFLGRSRTPMQERDTRLMPTISAPIISSSSSSGTATLGSPTRGDSPGFGLVRLRVDATARNADYYTSSRGQALWISLHWTDSQIVSVAGKR
jgi:actin cytoskeleton-regulatory complex protein PAN1